MNVHFSADGWDDLLSWSALQARSADAAMLASILRLIEDIRRSPFTGLGKPEPLLGDVNRSWSRRIDREHRLIYRVRGIRGDDQRVEILACRGHY